MAGSCFVHRSLMGQPRLPRVKTVEQGHESPVQVDVTWNGMVATVTVTGDLDITTATPLTERLRAVAAGRPQWLVLDLSGLVFADVTGARALYDAHMLLRTVCP